MFEDGNDTLADGRHGGIIDLSVAVVVDGGGIGREIEAEETVAKAPVAGVLVSFMWLFERTCMEHSLPVKESAVDNGSPGHARRLLGLEILQDIRLGSENGHHLNDLGIRSIAAELRGDVAFHTCLGRSVGDGVLLLGV